MAFSAVLDACVLIPMPIADLLLRLADSKQFRPLWSVDIRDEVERNLISQLGLEPTTARRRVTVMREHFPRVSVAPFDISVVSADDFLLDQLDLHPSQIIEVAGQIVADMRDPRTTWEDYLEGLDSCGLKLFARELRRTSPSAPTTA